MHRRFAQLRRGHLAEALEAADVDLLLSLEGGRQKLLLVGVVAGIVRRAAGRQAVERRQRQEQVTLLDQLRRLQEEEGHQQRGDEIGRAPSELQSLMRISYAVFCLKKKTATQQNTTNISYKTSHTTTLNTS